jgi:multidrug efflux pump subunit AcrA (membrane-fusion protein)
MMKKNSKFTARSLRQIIVSVLVLALVATTLIYFNRRGNKEPEVRYATLSIGNIASKMYVKARVQPGSVKEYSPSQRQRVLSIKVKPGDQVNPGDVLLTLDRSELLKLYNEARQTRVRLETEAATREQEAKEREAELAQARAEYEQQVTRLTGALTRIITQLTLLSSTPATEVSLESDLQALIQEQLADLDPGSEDFATEIQALLDSLNEGIELTENPEYQRILTALQDDVNILSTTLPVVLNGAGTTLTTGLDGNLQLSPQLLEQLSLLGLNTADPLTTARQNEQLYKKMYEDSVDKLVATSPGIVASVNTEPDSYAGPVSSSASSAGLDSLISEVLGSSIPQGLGGTTGSSSPAVVIYDNTRPKAEFSVSQFDSARIRLGLPVEYSLGGKKYTGTVTYKSLFVPNISFDSQSSNDLLKEVGLVSGLDQEPQLNIEMSIEGEMLTELTLGFLIDAEIQTASSSGVLKLPAEAMRRELDVYYVFLIDSDNRLVRRIFIPGIQSDMYVQVLSGLSEGDKVVLNPTTDLTDGMLVRLREA